MRMMDLDPWRDLKAFPPDGMTEDEEVSWRYQRYIKDYLRVVASIDDNVGRLLDRLDAARARRRHDRRVHVGPRVLPRRSRVVRQATDVRGSRSRCRFSSATRASSAPVRRTTTSSSTSTSRRRSSTSPAWRCPPCAGPLVLAAAARNHSSGLADLDVLPLLDAPRLSRSGTGPLRSAHPHPQADRLLQRSARTTRMQWPSRPPGLGALRPHQRPARNPESHR